MNLEKTSEKSGIQIWPIIICILLWFVGFTYNTGFGMLINIFYKAKDITMGLFCICVIFNHKKYRLTAEIVIIAAAVFYIYTANQVRNEYMGVYVEDYIWVWLLIPIMKSFKIEEKQVKLIGYFYGVVSTGVLLIGNVTGVFDGWDGNSVSMVQFFSYTIFISIFSEIKNKKNIRNLVIFSAVYFYLLNKFDSRSAILFSTIMLLCMLSVIPLKRLLNKYLVMLILLFPIIIAIIIVNINDLPIVDSINKWSLEVFSKPIFNGRDIIWEGGFKTWGEHFFIGNGNLSYGSYHNSAISMLVGGGSIGYLVTIGVCYRILSKALNWINDSVVYGLSTSFMIIWMQQSVELGIISATPNVIPYMILGLIYARITTLEGKKNDKDINNSPNFQYR